jgi:hypothetical protein
MWILTKKCTSFQKQINGESRVAKRARESDIPMDYLRMLASQIVQNTD